MNESLIMNYAKLPRGMISNHVSFSIGLNFIQTAKSYFPAFFYNFLWYMWTAFMALKIRFKKLLFILLFLLTSSWTLLLARFKVSIVLKILWHVSQLCLNYWNKSYIKVNFGERRVVLLYLSICGLLQSVSIYHQVSFIQ